MTTTTTRRASIATIAGLTLVLAATPAAADHDHHLVTPGTCVTDVADGQTSKDGDEPGGHVFHGHVHMRSDSNGTRLGVLTDNRVRVFKTAELAGDDPELVALREACGL